MANPSAPVSPLSAEQQDARFEAHTAAVAEFLNELYAIMVNPLAEGVIPVAEVKAALIKAALRDREALALRAPSARAELEQALRDVLEHARISFPNTPYRRALDRAKLILAALAAGEQK